MTSGARLRVARLPCFDLLGRERIAELRRQRRDGGQRDDSCAEAHGFNDLFLFVDAVFVKDVKRGQTPFSLENARKMGSVPFSDYSAYLDPSESPSSSARSA